MSQYSKNRNSRLTARYCGPICTCYICENRRSKGFAQVILQPEFATYVLFDKEGKFVLDSKKREIRGTHTARIALILCKPCTKRLAARLEKAIDAGELEASTSLERE